MKINRYQERLKKLARIVKNKKNILITTHKRPDGDAFGSTIALRLFFEKELKAKVKIVFSSEIDNGFRFLPSFGKFDYKFDGKMNYDLVIVCDANNVNRVSPDQEFTALLNGICKKKLIFIDHHSQKVEDECFFNISYEKAATCQIIYDFFRTINYQIDKDIATCLLTGIFTDTGGFLHANTTSEIMNIASNLMQRGAVLSKIARKTYFNKNFNTIKIWGKALERASLRKNGEIAFSYVTLEDLKECNASIEDLSGVGNVLGAISESKYSLVLAQTSKGKIKASLRSEDYKHCNVNKIAKSFNGGGHPLASGFEINGKLDEFSGKII